MYVCISSRILSYLIVSYRIVFARICSSCSLFTRYGSTASDILHFVLRTGICTETVLIEIGLELSDINVDEAQDPHTLFALPATASSLMASQTVPVAVAKMNLIPSVNFYTLLRFWGPRLKVNPLGVQRFTSTMSRDISRGDLSRHYKILQMLNKCVHFVEISNNSNYPVKYLIENISSYAAQFENYVREFRTSESKNSNNNNNNSINNINNNNNNNNGSDDSSNNNSSNSSNSSNSNSNSNSNSSNSISNVDLTQESVAFVTRRSISTTFGVSAFDDYSSRFFSVVKSPPELEIDMVILILTNILAATRVVQASCHLCSHTALEFARLGLYRVLVGFTDCILDRYLLSSAFKSLETKSKDRLHSLVCQVLETALRLCCYTIGYNVVFEEMVLLLAQHKIFNKLIVFYKSSDPYSLNNYDIILELTRFLSFAFSSSTPVIHIDFIQFAWIKASEVLSEF